MIKLTMFEGKWRIKIGDEIWEFSSKDEFIDTIVVLVDLKDTYGRIND